ncbi:guanine nucleotide-binding protein subunit beta-like protein 1 [Episyrphus balteatus]|uniref:guanine nucleotide-binding protein subunit beta-like protein 1 n=1 Tax=Episyrphus balteatus TaxID=286459 RepID=UPI002486789C|nr:guanine nucleotide-binding protein subunit beta-like protein 1 [Episyrphus balteatus]
MSVLPPDPVFVLRHSDMDSINSLAFYKDEKLFAGTLKGTVQLWDLQTNRCSSSFEVGSDPITALHHTDSHLITQEKGGTLKYWLKTNSSYVLEKTTETNHIAFCRTDYSNDDETLVFPQNDNSIGVLHTKDWQTRTLLVPDKCLNLGQLSCLKKFSLRGQDMVLAGYESGDFLSWDLRSEKPINEIHFNVGAATSVDFDGLSNRGVVGGTEDRLFAVTFQTKAMELSKVQEIPIRNPGINCVRIRSDRKIFTTAGWDGRIRIFSYKSLRPLAVLTEHKSGGIMDIAYSNDVIYYWNSPIMAAAGMDGKISLWSLYN